MNKYELTVVISAKLEDEARLATLEKVKDMIVRFGGTVTNVNDWGKKKLAYDIQKMSEAFYTFVEFDAPATAPAELEGTASYHGRRCKISLRFRRGIIL